MNAVSKVSELTYEDLASYIRIDELDTNDMNTLNNLLGVAKTFIQNYTGRTEEELDDYQDFVIVTLILVQDMWDNRTMYVDRGSLSHVVETILGMHSVNLL